MPCINPACPDPSLVGADDLYCPICGQSQRPAPSARRPINEPSHVSELQHDAQRVDTDQYQIQLRAFLEGYFIDVAQIPGIHITDRIALESYGIETAANVTAEALEVVPGFGQLLGRQRRAALLAWRQELERCFRYDPRFNNINDNENKNNSEDEITRVVERSSSSRTRQRNDGRKLDDQSEPASISVLLASEMHTLAKEIYSDLLRPIHVAYNAAIAKQRLAEIQAELRERYADWGQQNYKNWRWPGSNNSDSGIKIQSLIQETEARIQAYTTNNQPRDPLQQGEMPLSKNISMLDERVTALQRLKNEQEQATHKANNIQIRWGFFGGAIGVIFISLLLGHLAQIFSALGFIAFGLIVVPLSDLSKRSDAYNSVQILTKKIDTLRRDIGYCLDQWVSDSHTRSKQQREQAKDERQKTEKDIISQMIPLVREIDLKVHNFYPSTGFIGAEWGDSRWIKWTPATVVASALRIGSLTFYDPDVATLFESSNSSMRYELPALISLHHGHGLLFSAQAAQKAPAVAAVRSTVTRLLATMPPGKLYLTFFDPVGMGNNVSVFMKLRDYLDHLVNTRAWSEPNDIEQRLGELTDRIEDIIQRRIPDPKESIEDYNARAGDLAEPYRVLVVMDFPRNFTDTAARRLTSIAQNGPRCGIYPIVVRLLDQELPYRFDIDELERAMVCIDEEHGCFTWRDNLLSRAALSLDPTAPDQITSQVIDAFGTPAKKAEKVEIPFSRLLALDNLTPADCWTRSCINGIRIPLGMDGNGKLVSLAIDKEEEKEGAAQHGLLAGATGMGKSNLLHVLITAGAMAYSPDELQFYLVDLKAGVEFNAYAELVLPHAKVIAVDDDPDYGLSVLEGLNAELQERGDRFRNAGVNDYTSYRHKTGHSLPRILLIVDEFQVLFPSDSPAVANKAAAILDNLARLGRGPGIHVLLCSQNIGHGDTLTSKTADQMRIRIALGCSEADARRLLADDNLVPARFTRKGQALYNPSGGLKDSNREFQVALYKSEDLQQLRHFINGEGNKKDRRTTSSKPKVFVGMDPANLPDCEPLSTLLEGPSWPAPETGIDVWLGEPIAMRPPIAARLLPEGGSHLLIVNRDEMQAMGLIVGGLLSIAAQSNPEQAAFVVLDLSRADTSWAGLSRTLADGLPHHVEVGGSRRLPDLLETLNALLEERIEADRALPLHIYWVILGLHKARALHEGDSYGISSDEGSPQAQLLKLLRQGPELGMHVLAWCDSVRNLQSVGRAAISEMRVRVAGSMDEGDSTQFIDTTGAARLKPNRLVYVHKDEPESMTQFRPYALPNSDWLASTLERLKARWS